MNRDLRSWAVVALIAAATIAVATTSDSRVLAGNIGITVFEDGSHAMVQIPYRRDAEQGTLTVRVNGVAAVSDVPAQPRKYWNNNYFFTIPNDLPERVRVEATFVSSGRTQAVRATVRPTHARARVIDEHTDGPAAAARAMVTLAKRHGADDKLPATTTTTIAEITADTKKDFVAGLDLWAAKKGLPVHTERLGDAAGRTTLAALAPVLDRGDTAELMVNARMLVLIAIVHTEKGAFIFADDPEGPMGTNVYPVDDKLHIDWGFGQRWCGVDCPL